MIFDLPMTQNEPIFSVLTSPNSTVITKLVINNNTSKPCLCMLFAYIIIGQGFCIVVVLFFNYLWGLFYYEQGTVA